MKNIKDLGQMIEVNLAEFGYDGFYAECLYMPSSVTGKYSIRIFLSKKSSEDGDIEDLAFIGTAPNGKMEYRQDITSNSGTIKNDLYRIVRYMCTGEAPFINDYVREMVEHDKE